MRVLLNNILVDIIDKEKIKANKHRNLNKCLIKLNKQDVLLLHNSSITYNKVNDCFYLNFEEILLNDIKLKLPSPIVYYNNKIMVDNFVSQKLYEVKSDDILKCSSFTMYNNILSIASLGKYNTLNNDWVLLSDNNIYKILKDFK